MIYTCTGFKGIYPVPTAAVVEAPSQEEAARLLNEELKRCLLSGDVKPEDMLPFPGDSPVSILCNGDY